MGFLRLLAWGLPAAGLVAAGALGTRQPQPTRWIAAAVSLGDASYALYLVHPLIVLTMIRVWTWSGAAHHAGYWLFVAICIVIAIVAAEIVHRGFELPVARLLARRGKRGSPARIAPGARRAHPDVATHRDPLSVS